MILKEDIKNCSITGSNTLNKELKEISIGLRPTIQIGKKGLTIELIEEIKKQLKKKKLLKIKLLKCQL